MKRFSFVTALVVLSACRTAPPYDIQLHVDAARSLMERDDIVRAMQFVDGDRERIVAEWRELTEIPAPSAREAARAERVATLLAEYGLTVERDAAGNVMATRKGTGDGQHVVFDAHLDTVFPLSTNVTHGEELMELSWAAALETFSDV